MAEIDWKETRLEPSACPHCGRVNDAASSVDGVSPSPGDFSICIACAQVMVFDENLRTRMPTTQEYQDLSKEDKEMLRRYQRAVRAVDRRPTEEQKG